MNNIPPQTTQEQSVLSLIRKIHSGSLDPRLINIDDEMSIDFGVDEIRDLKF